MGFNELVTDGWATSNSRMKEEEVQEAIIQYQILDFWGEDEILGNVSGSDDDYLDDHSTVDDDLDMNLDSSFDGLL